MREQDAVAAAYIHEACPGSEIIGCGDGGADELGHVGHGVVEDAGLFGIAAKVFEAVGAGEEGARRLSCFHAVHDLAEARVMEVAPPEDEERTNGAGHAGSQEVGDFVISEATSAVLFEDSLAG